MKRVAVGTDRPRGAAESEGAAVRRPKVPGPPIPLPVTGEAPGHRAGKAGRLPPLLVPVAPAAGEIAWPPLPMDALREGPGDLRVAGIGATGGRGGRSVGDGGNPPVARPAGDP